MLNIIKGRILEMLGTVEEAAQQLAGAHGAQAQELREIIAEATEAIGNAAAESPRIAELGGEARALLDKLSASPARRRLREIFTEYRRAIDAIPTQFKVLFLPYYENTWDSLKSVYEAFAADERFICETVIIPIQRNTASGGTAFQYGDYLTPQGIPNTHYDDYNIEEDLPDIVFYNNPYDAVNIAKFQSAYMRPFARCLIYVPYYLMNNQSFNPEYYPDYLEKLPRAVALPGHDNANFIIAQSATLRRIAEKYSGNAPKIRVLGNPKCDYLHSAQNSGDWPHHAEWERILAGKTVFMLNTHYRIFEVPGHPLPLLDEIFDYVRAHEDIALIWRPHPQTFIVYEGQMNERVQKFYSLLDRAGNEERVILDRTGTALSAFMYSDALISSGSSIIGEALFLDKPVFLLREDAAEIRSNPQDYTRPEFADVLEFTHTINPKNLWMSQVVARVGLPAPLPAGLSDAELQALYHQTACREPFLRFMEGMLAGEDAHRALRAAYRRQAFTNLDGTCGESILHFVETLL